MRIALDATYSVDPHPSGIAVYSEELLRGLAAHVNAGLSQTPDDIPEGFAERFAAYVEPLHASVQGIRNLTVAPGAVQRFVYPLAGNEQVIGHDLLRDTRPEIAATVRRAIESRNVVRIAVSKGGVSASAVAQITNGTGSASGEPVAELRNRRAEPR